MLTLDAVARRHVERFDAQERQLAEATFCAVCTDDLGDDRTLAPLGRDDAQVVICGRCDRLPASDGRYDSAAAAAKTPMRWITK